MGQRGQRGHYGQILVGKVSLFDGFVLDRFALDRFMLDGFVFVLDRFVLDRLVHDGGSPQPLLAHKDDIVIIGNDNGILVARLGPRPLPAHKDDIVIIIRNSNGILRGS